MPKRNQGSVPRPKGFKYVRQPLHMPVAIAGQVRRGTVVGKGEEEMNKPKHTHAVWHVTEPTEVPGEIRALGNVSAPTQPDAVSKFKERFPHHKDKALSANIVSSTAHTPPDYPASHHYELARQDEMVSRMKKNAETLERTNRALWDHVRGDIPDFPLVGRDKSVVPKLESKLPPVPESAGQMPAPKKPASSINMQWLKEQKAKLTQKSEDTDLAGLLWLFCTSEGTEELQKILKEEGEPLKKTEGNEHIARWESRSGKHWVDLHAHTDGSYSYNAPDAGGHLGKLSSRDHAIKQMQAKIDSGYFQPDVAKTPMKRTK